MSYPPYGAVGSSSSTSRGQFDPARANGGAQPGLPPSLTSSSAPADAFSFISPSHPPAPVPSGLPSTSQAMWSVESASSHDERERPGDEIASVSDIGPSYGGIGGAADASALAYGSGIDDEAVGGSSSRSGKRAASVAFSTGETRSPGSTGGANARSAAACTYCRKQKMKCDGPLARPCRRCRIAQVECIFDDPSLGPKKGTTKIRSNAQAQALLEGRVAELEARLDRLDSGRDDTSRYTPSPGQRDIPLPSHQRHPSGSSSSFPPSTPAMNENLALRSRISHLESQLAALQALVGQLLPPRPPISSSPYAHNPFEQSSGTSVPAASTPGLLPTYPSGSQQSPAGYPYSLGSFHAPAPSLRYTLPSRFPTPANTSSGLTSAALSLASSSDLPSSAPVGGLSPPPAPPPSHLAHPLPAFPSSAAPYPDFYARETALAFSASQAHHQPPVHVPHRPESALSGFSSGMTGVVKSEPRADGRDE